MAGRRKFSREFKVEAVRDDRLRLLYVNAADRCGSRNTLSTSA
jgi:transposase-like protein